MESSAPKRPRCEAHGLATAPDGSCALCRRSQPPPVGTAFTTDVSSAGSMLAGLLGVAALGALVVAGLVIRRADDWSALPQRPLEPHLASQLPGPEINAPAQRGKVMTEFERQYWKEQEERAQRGKALAQQEQATRDAERQAWQLQSARSSVGVTMYSTRWCGACKAARAYMRERRIRFVEHDVEESESAQLIMGRLNPSGSVPTLDIEGQILVGFSSIEIESAVDFAARRRIGH